MDENQTPQESAVLNETPDANSAVLETEAPSAEPPKRRPGRPSNAEKAARAAGLGSEKPGAAKSAPQAKPQKRGAKMSAEALSTLAQQIQGMHAMAAMVTGMAILQISPDEAKLLAGGLGAVAEEYGLALDGKTGAALQLFGACAMVYAPRLIAIQKAKAQARANTVDANIVQ